MNRHLEKAKRRVRGKYSFWDYVTEFVAKIMVGCFFGGILLGALFYFGIFASAGAGSLELIELWSDMLLWTMSNIVFILLGFVILCVIFFETFLKTVTNVLKAIGDFWTALIKLRNGGF